MRKVTERRTVHAKRAEFTWRLRDFREYNGNGAAVTLERETLHVMDDKQRIALVETKIVENGNPSTNLYRCNVPARNHLGSGQPRVDRDGGLISTRSIIPMATAYQAMNSAAEVT